MELSKVCSRCEEEKPHSDFRKSQKGDKFGLHSWCYDCNRAARRQHYAKNKEKYAEWNADWNSKNQEKRRKYDEARVYDHAQRYRRRISLPGGREQKRAYDHNYRTRKRGAEGVLTAEVIQKVFETYGVVCLQCGSTENIEIDHIVPLSRGGTNLFDNLQPLCRAHNSSKGNRNANDYRPKGEGRATG